MDSNDDDIKEFAEYEESLESLLQMVDNYDKMSASIQSMISNECISTFDVASFESAVPGVLLDDYDVQSKGGVFSKEAFTISLEKVIDSEMDMAFFLMGKFFKLNLKAGKMLAKHSARLAGMVATMADDRLVTSSTLILSTTIEGHDKIPAVNFKALSSGQQSKLVKLVESYSGNDVVGEAEVVKTIAAIKSSKNGIEIMSKVFMPKYSNLLLPLFYIPNSDYKNVVRFFSQMDEVVLPRIDTGLSTSIMELNNIMSNRDWVALSKFNTSIFREEDKKPMYTLAQSVRADVKTSNSFRKNSAKTYASLSMLFSSDKKGLKNDPKYHQALPASVKDLDAIKNHVISISDVMTEMNKHSESRSGVLTKDLKRFRASKTVKESLSSGRSINKYSNAAYSQIMRELRDVAILAGFMANIGKDVFNAYTNVFSRSNKLNAETVKFIAHLNKIVGSN